MSTPATAGADRARSARPRRFLMTIGACATSGGVQALRNGHGRWTRRSAPSTRRPSTSTRSPTPRRSPTTCEVDLELTGCPVDRGQLLARARVAAAGRQCRARRPCRSASNASGAATSAWSWPRASRVSDRSRAPAAARSAPGSAAGATAASVPRSRRTRRRSPPVPRARDVPVAGRPSVPLHHRLRAGVPGRRGSAERTSEREAAAAMTPPLGRGAGHRARGGRGRAAHRASTATRSSTSGWTSTSRPGSSRPSCAGATSRRCPTSCPGSAASVRSRTR